MRKLLAALAALVMHGITLARNRYINAAQEYNVTVRTFPANLTAMAFGYNTKPNFSVENEKAISSPRKADFAPAPSTPQSDARGATK